jgi:hypothetical protein
LAGNPEELQASKEGPLCPEFGSPSAQNAWLFHKRCEKVQGVRLDVETGSFAAMFFLYNKPGDVTHLGVGEMD